MSSTIDSSSPAPTADDPARDGRPVPVESVTDLDVALARLDGVIDDLQTADLTALSDQAVAASLQRLEQMARRLPSVRNGLVAEAVGRSVPSAGQFRSVGAYLRVLLNVTAGEGAAIGRDAEDFVGYRSLTSGEPLPARLPAVAGALAAGSISTAHARMIAETMRKVPAAVPTEDKGLGEAILVRTAGQVDPNRLARACERFLDCVDPDGSLGADPAERAASRGFDIGRQNKAGMFPVRGLLDPETGAMLQAALDPLAAPQPVDDKPDPRSRDQRYHDAVRELARRALAAGDLPVRHGTPATMLVTIGLDQLEARTGVVSTAHGGQTSVREVLRIAADMGVIPVVLDSDGEIMHFGTEQRLATTAQRRALFLLDGGCAFPGCDVPPGWCETAHGEPFRASGRTSIDDLALVCGFHHRIADNQGWTIERRDGRAWFIPPIWADPAQTPRINEYFKPLQPD